jgi:8-hydroxy-5-deazaflavin:NADPH oxidoreductase
MGYGNSKQPRKDHSTMKVAIIGAGNVGKALGTSITRAGHEVTITAKHLEHARAAAQEIGAQPAESPAEAVSDADVVILAVPFVGAADEVTGEIRDRVAGKTVIDVTNPMKPDYSGLATEGSSAAEEFQKRLPGANVVKAFNTIFAANQAHPSPEIDGYVAGDDDKAKQQVVSLVESIGFSALDVGPLKAARYLEGMAVINIGLNAQNGWDWTSAWKLER